MRVRLWTLMAPLLRLLALFWPLAVSSLDEDLESDNLLRLGTSKSPSQRSLQQTSWSPAKVVTLGDSYASGLGIHRYLWDYDQLWGGSETVFGRSFEFTPGGGNCLREYETVPGGRLALDWGQPHLQMGCAGAGVAQVQEQWDYLNLLHPLEEYLRWEGSTLLVFAGGNDIRSRGGEDWADIIQDCILETSTSFGCDEFVTNRVWNLGTVEEDLVGLYSELAARASNAKIRVLGYPQLMQPTSTDGCSVLGVGTDEARWIDSQVAQLNSRLASAVFRARQFYPGVDLEFVDVQGYFTAGSCSQFEKQINGIVTVLGFIPTPSSFHPSQAGYDVYYAAIRDNLSNI